MERGNCNSSEHLNVEFSRLDMHVGRLGGLSANLLENVAEVSFDFGAPVSSMGKLPWIENSSVVRKSIAEFLPIEIVESLDEIR